MRFAVDWKFKNFQSRQKFHFVSLLTILLLLLPLCTAAAPVITSEPAPQISTVQQSNLPMPVDERTKGEIGDIERDISASYGGLPISRIISEKGTMVMGSDLSIAEREALLRIVGDNPIYSKFKRTTDEVPPEEILNTDQFLVVLGGPSQNHLTAYLEKNGMVEKSWQVSDHVIVRSGPTPGGGKFFIFSDLRGYNNVRKQGIEESPLTAIMPKEYVPIASFLLSILALAAIPVIRIYLAGIFKTKEREAGRKQVKEKFTGVTILGVPIRFRELLAVLGGAFFYGMGVAYLYAGFSWELFPMGLAAVAFVAILYYFRSMTRWLFDGKFHTRTEYVFWGTGGALCWISSVFGFTLQTPGFEVEQIPKELENKAAVMKWAVLSVAMVVALVIFIVNFISPHPYLPVFQTVASAIAVTEILPLTPMPGLLIKRWNAWLWAATFFTFIPIYFLINFYV